MSAVHCNEIPFPGILVGRLRCGFLLQTVGRLGTISSNQLTRAAATGTRFTGPRSAFAALMMYVAFQLLDRLLLLLNDGLHEVAD